MPQGQSKQFHLNLELRHCFGIRHSDFVILGITVRLGLVFWHRAREPSGMKSFLSTVVAGCACLLLVAVCGAEEVEWTAEANMDHQLFPSLIIATATVRPVEPDDQEAEQPDPYLLGERFGLVGVSIKVPAASAKVKVTVKENDLMAASSWSGELAEAGKDYFIAPKVNYKFERLRQMTQQVPLNITFEVDVDANRPAGNMRRCRCIRSTIVPSA
jgi:hypothetical protein